MHIRRIGKYVPDRYPQSEFGSCQGQKGTKPSTVPFNEMREAQRHEIHSRSLRRQQIFW